jgi:hypothetical protein
VHGSGVDDKVEITKVGNDSRAGRTAGNVAKKTGVVSYGKDRISVAEPTVAVERAKVMVKEKETCWRREEMFKGVLSSEF